MDELKIILDKSGMKIAEDNINGKTYFFNDNNISVVLLAKYEESFILIKQFRRAVNDFVIQLPGGGVQPGEKLEEAARREFLEETGYECGRVQYLGYQYPASWISNEITHVFYTNEILSLSEQSLEIYEKIEVLRINVVECIEKVRKSEINDSELSFALLQVIIKGLVKI